MITLILYYVLTALAAHALGYLLVNKEGPFDILLKFRRFVGITEDIENELYEGNLDAKNKLGMFGKMFTCDICASTAIALILTALLLTSSIFPEEYPTILKLGSPFCVVGILLLIKGV